MKFVKTFEKQEFRTFQFFKINYEKKKQIIIAPYIQPVWSFFIHIKIVIYHNAYSLKNTKFYMILVCNLWKWRPYIKKVLIELLRIHIMRMKEQAVKRLLINSLSTLFTTETHKVISSFTFRAPFHFSSPK